MFVRLVNLCFSYGDSVPILTRVNLQLASGWTGVVGANGAGKTTLLRLIAGDLEPADGHVRFDPPSQTIRLCPQTVETISEDIENFAGSSDHASRRIQGRLNLTLDDIQRWNTCSPGERKRWQVGAALAAGPSVLILDEPTDHLDLDARALLSGGLRRFAGIGILVSHDRVLLDSLTSYTVRVHEGSARIWRGSYSVAKRSWEAEQREYQDEYDRVKHQHQMLKRRLDDKRRAATGAERQANSGARLRMRGKRDHDATSMLSKGKAQMASERLSRDAGLLRRSLEREEQRLSTFQFRKTPGRSVFVDYVPAPYARLFTIDSPEICAGERVVLRDVHLVVGRESRIRVAGPNGAGKSTLLAAMLADSKLPDARLLYLPQELTAEAGAVLLRSVRELPAADRSRVLTMVAALGVEPDRLLESASLSPGEARKLKLAYGLGWQVWAMVLDEPTNHLDMPAIERLEDALVEYPGALLMVTHDEALARRCVSEQWRIANGRIEVN
ncbi:MAG TPA: ATP-binding cassette domain-containing protein [Candidatus Binataceae bacterium]